MQREADERERQRRENERREIQLKAAKEQLEKLKQTSVGAKVFDKMDEVVGVMEFICDVCVAVLDP